ncbi:MAG TPA: SIMPL domain-containing protein [Candidatus Paceibacterota bacterium]|nr:SIMPL domain-containing protein [Candidatus Paceibacterota bacterium]
MRTFVLLCAAVAVFAGPVLAHEAPEREYTVAFTGEAVVTAVPDRAVVSLTVQGKPAKKRREAEENQSVLAQGLVTALRDAGVPERDIKSQYYQLQDYYEQKSDGRPERKGYYAVQQFRVRLPRDRASAVLDAVPDFANVNGVQFEVSNARALRDEAIRSAIADALTRAQSRAADLGITLGPVLAYQESALGRPEARPSRVMAAMSEDAGAAPELPAGEDELRVSVTVTFRIDVP